MMRAAGHYPARWFGSLAIAVGLCAGMLSGCASLEGYPKDPENTSRTMTNLQVDFDGTAEQDYYKAAATDEARTPLRNTIIIARLRGYNIEFSRFERELLGYSNSLSIGSDLVALTLGGLTSTVGSAGTKAALGAASNGIIGANSAINKDLYFQKTIPALIAQMEANRAKKLLTIIQAMQLPDSKYSLAAALSDLDAYRDSGSIPDAVSSITQSAGSEEQVAEQAITFARTGLDLAQLPTTTSIRAKLKDLKDAQILAVASAMQPYLATRPAELQQLVTTIDPSGKRFVGDASKARQVTKAWVEEEDMNVANAAQWTDAIAAATK
jgi:hypothetical protein